MRVCVAKVNPFHDVAALAAAGSEPHQQQQQGRSTSSQSNMKSDSSSPHWSVVSYWDSRGTTGQQTGRNQTETAPLTRSLTQFPEVKG